MTADEIAEQIAAHLNAIPDKVIEFQAVKADDAAEVATERADFGVYVLAKDEREEAFDRANCCRRERVVSVAVNGPIRGQLTRATYLAAVEQIRFGLEGTEFGGYLWDSNETVSLWDREAMQKNRFMALFETTYYEFA